MAQRLKTCCEQVNVISHVQQRRTDDAVTSVDGTHVRLLPIARLQAPPIHAVMLSLSIRPVCLSVTFVNSVKTNKRIFKIFAPSGSQTILVFPYQTSWKYCDECKWSRQFSANVWLHRVLWTVQLPSAKFNIFICDEPWSCWHYLPTRGGRNIWDTGGLSRRFVAAEPQRQLCSCDREAFQGQTDRQTRVSPSRSHPRSLKVIWKDIAVAP